MNSDSSKFQLETIFKSSIIIFSFMAIGQLLILVVFLFLEFNSVTETKSEFDKILVIVVPVVGLSSMFSGRSIYNKNLSRVNPDDSIKQKATQYRNFKLILWAVLEGSGLFTLIAFFITSNYFYLIVFVFVFGFFLLNRPSKEGFVNDMKISGNEMEEILRS
ncbi:MAG TPA: hypothetical protein VH917_05900 [Ignavibacteriaceae bacterium]